MECYLFNFSLLGSNLRLQFHNLLRQTAQYVKTKLNLAVTRIFYFINSLWSAVILKGTEGNRGWSLERRNWLPSSTFLADKIHVRRLGLKLDKNYKAPRVQRSGKKSQPESCTKFYCNGKYTRLCYKCFTMSWYSAILCPFSLISASASACSLVAFVIFSLISSSFFCRQRKINMPL